MTDNQIERLRAAGWSVAVHNDYRIGGEPHTFWLLTHPCGRWIKGEGRTDQEALEEAMASLNAPAVPEGWEPIETAPRDGTAILAASVNHDAQEVVCWQDGAPTGSFAEVEEGWVNSGPTKDRFYANPLWFTHWRPISARPLPTEGEGTNG